MNGCHSKNINNNHDGSDVEPNSLVAITDKASEIDCYVASMKQVTSDLDTSNKADIAKINELQALVRYQGEVLLRNIEQYGIHDSKLIKKAEDIKTKLVSLQDRLTKLKNMCNTNKTASIDVMVDKVSKLVRTQIACALDAAYS